MSDILSNGLHRSVKERKCILCGEAIPVAELHRVCVAVEDGQIYTTRYHQICDQVPVYEGWDEQDWETPPDVLEFRRSREEFLKEQQTSCPYRTR